MLKLINIKPINLHKYKSLILIQRNLISVPQQDPENPSEQESTTNATKPAQNQQQGNSFILNNHYLLFLNIKKGK